MRLLKQSEYATAWTVEASSDGLNWTVIEERSGVQYTPVDFYYSTYDNVRYVDNDFNAKEFFHFTGYRNGGLAPMPAPLSVQVDDGATLDLLAFDDGQPIGTVTIDLAAGGGTVKGGRVVPNGTLILNGVAETGADISNALPLAFEGTLDAQNFRSWKVVIDGKASSRHPVYANGRLSIPSLGMRIIVF